MEVVYELLLHCNISTMAYLWTEPPSAHALLCSALLCSHCPFSPHLSVKCFSTYKSVSEIFRHYKKPFPTTYSAVKNGFYIYIFYILFLKKCIVQFCLLACLLACLNIVIYNHHLCNSFLITINTLTCLFYQKFYSLTIEKHSIFALK